MKVGLAYGSKVRLKATFGQFKQWQLGSSFDMGQDVYVIKAIGRWALIQSKPLSQYDYGRRTVPITLLEKVQ